MSKKLLFAVVIAACNSSQPPPAPLDAGYTETVSAPKDASDEEAQAPPRPNEVLGTYETKFSGPSNRNKNIERAMVHEAVIEPGATFSLNESIGERSEKNGFFKAPVIFKGELTDGVGGGVCQVSSTLHAAARIARLEIVSRSPHTRPSAYIPVGLDSTIVWPDVDLKIRNPFDMKVTITMDSRPGAWKGERILRAQIVGPIPAAPPPKYKFDSKKKDDFERIVRRPDGGAPSTVANVQKGRNGAEVFSSFLWADGETVKWKSVYPPTNEIWEVGENSAADLESWSPPVDAGSPQDAGRD